MCSLILFYGELIPRFTQMAVYPRPDLGLFIKVYGPLRASWTLA